VTLFEYLSVLTSIIFSLSAAQLLTRIRSVLNPKKRYWVHSLWVFLVLFLHLLIWWEFWGYRDVASWNILNFGLFLLNPVVLFVCAYTLVHSEKSEIEDWASHFYEARKTIFFTLALLPLGSVIRRFVLSDVPVASFQNLPELCFFLLFGLGFLHAGARVQIALVVISWLLMVFVTAGFWYEPGAVVNAP
jgi:hypothetical protein